MSAFDERYIKTSKGGTVDFSRAIIIATTNAGHTNKPNAAGFTTGGENSTAASVADLSRDFDVELLNRFTRILNFHPITEELFIEIPKDLYRRQTEATRTKNPAYSFLPREMPEEDALRLTKENYVREFGARPARNAVKKYIQDAILSRKKA